MRICKGLFILVPVLHVSVIENVISHVNTLMGQYYKVLYGTIKGGHIDAISLTLLIYSDLKGYSQTILIPDILGIKLELLFKVFYKSWMSSYKKIHSSTPEIYEFADNLKSLAVFGHEKPPVLIRESGGKGI